jgi:hypothetical protein
MLAISTHIDAVSVPQAANDQLAIRPMVTEALALDAANDDSAEAGGADGASDHETREPAQAASWLMDWSRAWTAAASSMIDASAASMKTITTAASETAARTEPARSEISLWSQPSRTAPPRSWYRPPQANLLDPSTWGFPAPFAVYGVPVTLPAAMGFNPMQNSLPGWLPMASPMTAMAQAMQPSTMAGWPGFGSAFGSSFGSGFGLPFYQPYANPFARPPENPMTAWMSGFAPQPVNPWTSLSKAMTGALTPVPYSNYRSDSGHAVAQIAKPAAKASSAQEAAIAIMNLFAWPSAPTQ